MSGSSRHGKLYSSLILGKVFEAGLIRRVVDVGAGCGTYRRLLGDIGRTAHWTAVEVWSPYIRDYGLEGLYDEVANVNVNDFPFEHAAPDLVIFGDVLEHMTKEQAVAATERAVAVARLTMLSLPVVHYPQDECNGNPFERHVKDDWSHDEVAASFRTAAVGLIDGPIGVYFLTTDPGIRKGLVDLHAVVAEMIKTDPERFKVDHSA